MTTDTIKEITCSAPVNIAVIKYWGKRDVSLLLPTNSSLSLTLSQDDLKTTTTIQTSIKFTENKIYLNGKVEDFNHKRLQNVILACQKARKLMEDRDQSMMKISNWKIVISTFNNFPTAAGLASSASGFACLAFTLAKLYELPMSMSEISILARLGSGSACRSLFGGFVKWEMGTNDDGSDSLAVQVASEKDWAEIKVLILVVSDLKKDVGSSIGMQESVETSSLFTERIKNVVPERMIEMDKAIKDKDFDQFAKLTMRDSNQFHAICLDTFPPIFYLNDISRAIIKVITKYNAKFVERDSQGCYRGYRVAYTYDAGPNAVLYVKQEFLSQVLGLVSYLFPFDKFDAKEYFGDCLNELNNVDQNEIQLLAKSLELTPFDMNSLTRIISTSVGGGPRVLSTQVGSQYSLLNDQGLPIMQ